MPLSVARNTKRNQVLHFIATELASRFQVMYLQIVRGAALLTTPAISLQYQLSYQLVFRRIQFDPRLLLSQTHQVHSIYRLVSRGFAPARKSAQIISRQ